MHDHLGADVTTGTSVVMGDAWKLRCRVQYSNGSDDALADVYVRLSFATFTQLPLSPALPDGVAGLADPDSQTWALVRSIGAVPGSPAPTTNLAAQTVDFALGSVAAFTASELSFDWFPSRAFPVGTYDFDVQAFIGGPPGTGSADTSLDCDLHWDTTYERFEVWPIAAVDPSRRYVGTALIDHLGSPTDAHIDARMTVYLPYWNGAEVVADGAFDPTNDLPLVDESDLELQLLLLRVDSYDTVLEEVMPAGTPLDGNGLLSWPPSGDNAELLLIYDPETHTITANVGVVWAAEKLDTDGYGQWRVRWDGAINGLVPLSAGDQLPVQMCFSADDTGSVLPGTPGYCDTKISVVGAESLTLALANLGCAGSNSVYAPCRSEARPFSAGSDGVTMLLFENRTSVTGDVELVAQLPGDGTTMATFTGARFGAGNNMIRTGPAVGASDVEIWLSTGAADQSIPVLTGRVVPSSSAVWVPCPTTGGGTTIVECDTAALAIDLDDVTEVKFVLPGARSQYLSLQGAPSPLPMRWIGEIDWTLEFLFGSSMGNGTAYSASDITGAGFGFKAAADFASSSVNLSTFATETGEVSGESFARSCGVQLGGPGGDTYAAASCPTAAGPIGSASPMSALRITFGLENVGSTPNVTGPIEICVPIPHGYVFENTVTSDPSFPRVIDAAALGTTADETATVVPPSEYTFTFTPVDDLEIRGDLCVQLPDYTVAAGRSVQVVVDGRLVLGVHDVAYFYNASSHGTWSANGEDPAGAPTSMSSTLNFASLYISGAANVHVTAEVSPSALIGHDTDVCFDYTLDTHAFLDDGNLDAGGATLPTQDAASYHWIPTSADASPASLTSTNTGDTDFTSATSPDAAVWVHTSPDPTRGDASTLAGNGWSSCAAASAVCDAVALAGLSLAPSDVRWVAFEYGDLAVSDVEPRGQAPLGGNPRINVPYGAAVCVVEAGSPDGATIATVLETVSSNLLPVHTEPVEIVVAAACPVGGFGTAETCNTLDDDCDGDVDDGFAVGESCSAGVGECLATGVTECDLSGGATCGAVAGTPVAEACDDLDNDCDGASDEDFTDLGTSCTVGAGACANEGVMVCSEDGGGARCDAVPLEDCDEPEIPDDEPSGCCSAGRDRDELGGMLLLAVLAWTLSRVRRPAARS